MAEDIYGPRIPHIKGKIMRRKIQHVYPVKIPSVTKTILDKYKEVTTRFNLMHINGINFLNTISLNIMFSTGSVIKNQTIYNIADGITQVNKLYMNRDFNIIRMYSD